MGESERRRGRWADDSCLDLLFKFKFNEVVINIDSFGVEGVCFVLIKYKIYLLIIHKIILLLAMYHILVLLVRVIAA